MLRSLPDVLTVAASLVALLVGGRILFAGGSNTSQSGSAEGTTTADRQLSLEEWTLAQAGGHVLGLASARLTVVEFGDYECPACVLVAGRLSNLLRNYGEDVRIVYRHYPLSYHLSAAPAARAANCAGDQGMFAEYHDRLFEKQRWQRNLETGLLRIALDVGLADSAQFVSCLGDFEVDSRIESDMAHAEQLGFRGTPMLIVDGLVLGAVPDSQALDSIVRGRLGRNDR